MSYVYSWILQLLIVILTSGIFIWKYSTRKFDYWKKRGVFNPQPVPFLGNLSDILFMRKNLADLIKTLYSTTDLPYLGFFAFDEPYLMVRCPKLIQRVLIKDFSYFSDRSVATPPHDEIMASFTFLQKNPAWKRTRNKLTPVFSSGKIKRMFTFVNSVGENLVDYLQKNLGDIEAKEVASKYSTDVIAKCCFGIESKCFDDEDTEFRKFGRNMFDFSWRNAFAFVIYFFRPRWVGTFRVDFINQSSIKFFCQVFSETISYRKLSKRKMGDFADLINDLKEASQTRESALNEAYGQAIMFFAAGFETTSAAISFTLHELCLNKDIQDNLRKEISETIGKYGEVTYEAIQEMKYLRMCINETLRKYPIIPFLDRICKENYEVPNTNLIIEKGTPIYIPIYGLHMDGTHFPDPEKYDPDRFLKKNINGAGFVYIPFGDGPRNCLGERFGLLSTQVALVHIISRFEVEKCDKTPDPVEFEPKCIAVLSKVGLPMILRNYGAEIN
ncbi:cytochrome P450 6k1 [Leptinotarsa decemlineata]|uniref:cytochrome P450 6k1 n=1 Tax=Leptinotarsa decemlineata TaxID=7539 RepID=UPI003D30C8F1